MTKYLKDVGIPLGCLKNTLMLFIRIFLLLDVFSFFMENLPAIPLKRENKICLLCVVELIE